MKKLFTLLLLFAGSLTVLGQNHFVNNFTLDPYNPAFVKGVVLVKFTNNAQPQKLKSTKGIASTGIVSVDKILQQYKVKSVDKLFVETRAQYNKKAARVIRDLHGKLLKVPALYNIYKLRFDTATDVKQLANTLQKDKNVDFAEPDYLFYSSDVLQKGRTQTVLHGTPPTVADQTTQHNNTPNDPLFTGGG